MEFQLLESFGNQCVWMLPEKIGKFGKTPIFCESIAKKKYESLTILHARYCLNPISCQILLKKSAFFNQL